MEKGKLEPSSQLGRGAGVRIDAKEKKGFTAKAAEAAKEDDGDGRE